MSHTHFYTIDGPICFELALWRLRHWSFITGNVNFIPSVGPTLRAEFCWPC